MNSNELNKRIMKVVQCTIEPLVTEYLQQHPEYFSECISGVGLISNYSITLSYQPDKAKDIVTVKPTIFIELGNCTYGGHRLICYDHHPEDLESTFRTDSIVSVQEVSNG